MKKYYIMLVDLKTKQMHVPVKALLNPHNNKKAYCAGMPQFLGGSGKSKPFIVLQKEVTEESRGTLELILAPPSFFTDKNMSFYWASEDKWKQTGTSWKPTKNPDEQEMDRIVVVDLKDFNNNMTDDQIIEELVKQTGSDKAAGTTDFNKSVTRTAFIKMIRILLKKLV